MLNSVVVKINTTPGAIGRKSRGRCANKCILNRKDIKDFERSTDWLHDKQLYYWGDLDAHGFQILDQCRKLFPKTQALLMDRATFEAHQHLITKGETTLVTELPYLTDEERNLFQQFNQNGLRVEQGQLGEE